MRTWYCHFIFCFLVLNVHFFLFLMFLSAILVWWFSTIFFFQFPLVLCFMSLLYIYVLRLLWSLYKTSHSPFSADSLLSSFAYTGSILFFFPYFAFYYLLLSCCWLVANLCQLFATTLTVAHQAPFSVGFPRQEHWSGLPSPSPSFAHLKNQVFFFFFLSSCWILKFFIYSGHKSLVKYVIWKYFLPVCGLSFHSLDGAFIRTKVLNLMMPNLWCFSLMDCDFWCQDYKLVV